jgi:hypothetical protein
MTLKTGTVYTRPATYTLDNVPVHNGTAKAYLADSGVVPGAMNKKQPRQKAKLGDGEICAVSRLSQ